MQEAAALPLQTNTGLDNRKLLMWLFLGSECLFFGGFISAYLLYRDRNLVGPYPKDLYDIPFTSVSSFVLLMSSVRSMTACWPRVKCTPAAWAMKINASDWYRLEPSRLKL